MKGKRRIVAHVICLVLGAILLALGVADVVDEFWTGMGSALLVVGIMRLVQMYRLNKDEAYREAVQIEATDERNSFIRNKAWAWAGFLFVMVTAVSVIVLQLMGQEQLAMMAGVELCLLLVLYWGAYFVLRKKY